MQSLLGSELSGIDLVCPGSAWVSEIIDFSEDIAVTWSGMEL